MPLLLAWKIKFGLKIQPNAWGNYQMLYHKTNVLNRFLRALQQNRAQSRLLYLLTKHSSLGVRDVGGNRPKSVLILTQMANMSKKKAFQSYAKANF